jgi:predicted RNA-binding protein with PIN domain
MRWLIDGYNVMHAGGRLGAKLSREGFRRARRRFLDEISAALGPDRAQQATVVFDASVHPGDFALDGTYRGMGILFALGDENADARIEEIISGHANARTLTVVSTDRRIRQAAARRRAKVLTADQFWELIDDLKEREGQSGRSGKQRTSDLDDQRQAIDSADSARWLETFREVAETPAIRAALAPDNAILTDAEIAEIEREIERENGRGHL